MTKVVMILTLPMMHLVFKHFKTFMKYNEKPKNPFDFKFQNIRVYLNEIQNGLISFSNVIDGYEPMESDRLTYKALIIKSFDYQNQNFYVVKTEQHIRVGNLKYLGKKTIYYFLFLPKERSFVFKGIQPNNFADIISAKPEMPIITDDFLKKIIDYHFFYLNF